MNKYDEIMNHLKGMKPNVEDEEELTESIMASLPDFDGENCQELTVATPTYTVQAGRNITSSVIVVLRTILSVTAVFLIGLFIWLNSGKHVSEKTEAYILTQRTEHISHLSGIDGYSTPAELYMCYMESRRTKENSISKIRKMINEQYENN